ncbi:hypothetical protein Gohar_004090 [Gossypium harknessii]|uniref:Uncharacterized protein n=1 Tax=Gossypium harknessii TaxID=34285 RepID=A0A7J9H4H0_9ROSI|nr:hypothetical protein [Gossypium harknessii]
MATSSFLRNKYWVLRHGKSIPNEKGLIVSSLVISEIDRARSPCVMVDLTRSSKHGGDVQQNATTLPFAKETIKFVTLDCNLTHQENGIRLEYQLASEGVEQAKLAGKLFLKELKENDIPLENVRMCYSPFARTRHTAEVVASTLNLPFEGPQCKVMEDLRERYFGPSFELLSHDKQQPESLVLLGLLSFLTFVLHPKQYTEIWAMDEKDPFTRPEGGESVDDVASRLASAMATMESEYQGHGDPLQILQTILNAASKQMEPSCNDLASRIQAVRIPSILSQHRNFALLTGEIRAVR